MVNDYIPSPDELSLEDALRSADRATHAKELALVPKWAKPAPVGCYFCGHPTTDELLICDACKAQNVRLRGGA